MNTAVATHRIGRICANPPGSDRGQNKNAEYVELVTAGSLALHDLEHVVNPQSAERKFESFFQFPADANFNPGIRVVVHNGGGKDGYDAARVYHYYAEGPHGKGNWMLNNTGDVVRLLDARGTEVDRRVLKGNECEGNLHSPVPTPTPRPPQHPPRSSGGNYRDR